MLKLVSWNVNGLRALLKKDLLAPVTSLRPDILCLQETKIPTPLCDSLDIPFKHIFWHDAQKKGYSGTAILSNVAPLAVLYDLVDDGSGVGSHPREGRVITAEFDAFNLVNVYTPNSKAGLERLGYRHREWEPDFRAHLRGVRKRTNKPVIVCGDLNVAHKERDLARPEGNHKSAGFTKEERQCLNTLLDDGFVDSFRLHHPDQNDVYTWWSYRTSARKRNVGWRIDYFLVAHELKTAVKQAHVYADIFGSDHCPVGIDLTFDDAPECSGVSDDTSECSGIQPSSAGSDNCVQRRGVVVKKDGGHDICAKANRLV